MPWLVNRRLGRFQNELMNKHYGEVETVYRKMRGWRHDYHNHIQVLKAHLELQEYEKAQKNLDMLAEDLTAVDTVVKTGNVMVDAILNSKLTLMKDHEINVDVTAIVPQEVSISGVQKKERFIRIYIDIIKKQLYISVVNSMEGQAKKNGTQYLSSKQGLHGFGLLRIDSIVSKYHGYINRQSEPGVFATEVTLPLYDDTIRA